MKASHHRSVLTAGSTGTNAVAATSHVAHGVPWMDFAWPLAGTIVMIALASAGNAAWEIILRPLFPGSDRLVYEQASLAVLLWQHIQLVLISSAMATVIGVGAGVAVTRPWGAAFNNVATDLANVAQTFPPLAVFALAIPLLGFGFGPAILALTIYGILPVLHNTIAGLETLPSDVLDSGRGLGLTPMQSLWRVELPLASPVIIAGVRISVVVNVATATVAAAAAAGGLGLPIISGLNSDNPAITLQGASMATLLALTLDGYLGAMGRWLGTRAGLASK